MVKGLLGFAELGLSMAARPWEAIAVEPLDTLHALRGFLHLLPLAKVLPESVGRGLGIAMAIETRHEPQGSWDIVLRIHGTSSEVRIVPALEVLLRERGEM